MEIPIESEREINDADELALKLGGTKCGDGWKCKCPAHEDKKASLSISLKEGKILWHCHAGCSQDEVRKAIAPYLSPKVTQLPQRKIVATYNYHDEFGTVVFQKVRYEPKNFTIRKWDKGKWLYKGIMEGVNPPLYNLPALLEGISKNKTVLICEGEKDVNNLKELQLDNYVATTNFDGGAKWRDVYTPYFQGSNVIILEDNDPTGKERTQTVFHKLKKVTKWVKVVKFEDLPEKSDVSDYLENHTKEELLAKLKEAESVKPSQSQKEHADYQDYIDLIYSLPAIKQITRCILTDDLMALRADGSWCYLISLLEYIQSHARERGSFFKLNAFKDHIQRHRFDDKHPELRISIPDWDGIDRLKEQADLFRFSNVSSDCFYELMLFWGSTIFRRLEDPTIQPITPIFQGCQGLGKDSLISALTAEFGVYQKELDFSDSAGKEAKKQLHTALVFLIPEFDQTARTEIATLKHILTTASTDTRLSYDARDEKRAVRASFIASCNKANVLIDETGNRRFWIFNAEYLGFETTTNNEGKTVGTGKIVDSYPGLYDRPTCKEERLQILAQFKTYAARNFRPQEKYIQEMRDYVAQLTPRSVDEMILEEFDSALEAKFSEVDYLSRDDWPTSPKDGQPLFTLQQIDDVISKLSKDYQRPRQNILKLLGACGRRERSTNSRSYKAAIPF